MELKNNGWDFPPIIKKRGPRLRNKILISGMIVSFIAVSLVMVKNYLIEKYHLENPIASYLEDGVYLLIIIITLVIMQYTKGSK